MDLSSRSFTAPVVWCLVETGARRPRPVQGFPTSGTAVRKARGCERRCRSGQMMTRPTASVTRRLGARFSCATSRNVKTEFDACASRKEIVRHHQLLFPSSFVEHWWIQETSYTSRVVATVTGHVSLDILQTSKSWLHWGFIASIWLNGNDFLNIRSSATLQQLTSHLDVGYGIQPTASTSAVCCTTADRDQRGQLGEA
ncbi:hypothetical protein B0T20DRAFT_101805 [Sordaria brevicollis]|uniref:Uncharacterized protein n=1 Tax=Sordaria brevicollis TaxID=83679 RepID=A0AAE0NW90_SORBR|nr:hypothetical protein B0T20DRAFT_101805 [Sordaria brevicollis]